MKSEFKKESFFSLPKKDLFEFHEREDAFPLLTPPFENIEVSRTALTLAPSGEVVRFAVKFGPFRFRFENIHTMYEPYDRFVDEQKKGLFSKWRHEHLFFEGGASKEPASMLSDRIEYAHPLLPFFNFIVRARLRKLFEYRHKETFKAMLLEMKSNGGAAGKKVIVTGATGLIGKRVVEILLEKRVNVVAFVRNEKKAKKLLGDSVTLAHWDFHNPKQGNWESHISGSHGVVHLAGTPLFQKRWSSDFKKEMENSRVRGTSQLVDAIMAAEVKPKVFVSASALGYYGTAFDGIVHEKSKPAGDLLARICVNWEREAKRLDLHDVRSVQMRIGIVLSTKSGALKELLPLFKIGLGGTIGDERPYINWIHLEDVSRMFVMALETDDMKGAYNATGPAPVTNGEFAKSIARVLKRPAFTKVPVPLLKLIIGEAGEYASGGPRAGVKKIEDAGYRFFFSKLEEALVNLLSARKTNAICHSSSLL